MRWLRLTLVEGQDAMSVHVGEIRSDITVTDSNRGPGPSAPPRWSEQERLATLLRAIECDRERLEPGNRHD